MVRVLAFSGSLRKDSFNQKLVRIASEAAKQAGAEVTLINLCDYPLPVFDQDLEAAGVPENVRKLKELFLSHDGLLIASPEYNSSVTAALKNAIDWVSRGAPGEPAVAAFRGKVAAIMSASTGALGGLRGLVHLRSILGNIQVLVLPDQVSVSGAGEAFDDLGGLQDPKRQQGIEGLGTRLVEVLMKLKA
ncbi:MAG: NAD(P)H-dependent oxidoreductase [Planctomycetaceae bacterium]|nr:NAD(P)H-dependent oxidoreductase [Planctomycetaceae bacterium]